MVHRTRNDPVTKVKERTKERVDSILVDLGDHGRSVLFSYLIIYVQALESQLLQCFDHASSSGKRTNFVCWIFMSWTATYGEMPLERTDVRM